MKLAFYILLPISLYLGACNNIDNSTSTMEEEEMMNTEEELASIVSVTTSGNQNNYNFSVGISSPDTGCDAYANWWEVITEDGILLYRRVLGHSHVNEQPFTRSGDPVEISANQTVIIRAHMNTSGYGTTVFKGSVSQGFNTITIAQDFAQELANEQPLPKNCAF